jgi:hypothetical protein
MTDKILALLVIVALIGAGIVQGCREPVSPVSGFPIVHEGEIHRQLDLTCPCGFWAEHSSGRDLICENGVRLPFRFQSNIVVFDSPSPMLADWSIPTHLFPVIAVFGDVNPKVLAVHSLRNGGSIPRRDSPTHGAAAD